MRRDFTAISAFSMAISFVAAVVLCLQIAQIKGAPELEIAGPTAWAVELAIFGTAVYAWRPRVTLSGWVLGIATMVLVRVLVATCAGTGLLLVQDTGDIESAIARASTLGPRICASFFSLMVFYPLRVMLPVRTLRRPDRRRFAESAAVTEANGGAEDPAMVLVGGDETIPVWDARRKPPARARPGARPVPQVDLDGSLELPLDAVLAQAPQDLWADSAGKHDPSEPVSIPLQAVVPQLSEARVVFTVADLCQWLPPGVLRAPAEPGPEGDVPVVNLPLELVVPRLPAEALQLPPPSPPAWAEVGDADSVLFATV